ncbi:unnamed protein product [Didymodactylos carnosus]|uniref:Uncharacterized protein n=1 Tax=Didymodactylos carnosus TaxID=1234261 RepID=A0A8S2I949_9BILA|nr:unnamed protein product [Didymodactylos carnosus]CAF3711007.1 unnamed protein product [Didymodactylos carnosus]
MEKKRWSASYGAHGFSTACKLITCALVCLAVLIAAGAAVAVALTRTSSTSTTTRTSTTSTTTTTKTTTSTSTTTSVTTTSSTTSPTCAGALSSYTTVSLTGCCSFSSFGPYSYIATATTTTVIFAVKGTNPHNLYLDSFSFMDTTTSTELLLNGGFSSGTLSSWTEYDPCNCGSTAAVLTSCLTAGTYCYWTTCTLDYLSQIVTTVVGRTYHLSFSAAVNLAGGGNNGGAQFHYHMY